MRKYVLSVACSSDEKMKRALLDKSYHHYHYVTSHAPRLLNLQLLLLCVLLLVFHCLPILANHGNQNCQTPAVLDMVDGSQGVETLICALWFSCDVEQDWNQFAFRSRYARRPLSGQEKWRRLAGGRFGIIALYLQIAAIYNQIFGVFLCDIQKIFR